MGCEKAPLELNAVISRKRQEIRPKLLLGLVIDVAYGLSIDTKNQRAMTLDDLELLAICSTFRTILRDFANLRGNNS